MSGKQPSYFCRTMTFRVVSCDVPWLPSQALAHPCSCSCHWQSACSALQDFNTLTILESSSGLQVSDSSVFHEHCGLSTWGFPLQFPVCVTSSLPFSSLKTLSDSFQGSALSAWFLISRYFSSFIWPLNKHLQRRRGKERASEREPGKESGVCSSLTVVVWITGATADFAKSFHGFSATPWAWEGLIFSIKMKSWEMWKRKSLLFGERWVAEKEKNKKTWAKHGEGG